MSSFFGFWKPAAIPAETTPKRKKRDRRNENFSPYRRSSPTAPAVDPYVHTVNVLQKRKRQVTYATPGASPAKRRTRKEGEEEEIKWQREEESPRSDNSGSYSFLSGLFDSTPERRQREEEAEEKRERAERKRAERQRDQEKKREREEEERSRSTLASLLLPWATQDFCSGRPPLQLNEATLEDLEYEEEEGREEGYEGWEAMGLREAELIELSSDDEVLDEDYLAHDSGAIDEMPYRPKALRPRPVFGGDGMFLAATIDPPDYLEAAEFEEYRDLLEQEQAMRTQLERIRRQATVEAKRDAASLLKSIEQSAENAWRREQEEEEAGDKWELDVDDEEQELSDSEPGLSSWGLFSMHAFAGVPSWRPAEVRERAIKEKKARREQAIQDGLEELRSMAEAHKKRMFERARTADRWRALSDEEEEAIYRATHGRDTEVVVMGFNMEIKRMDLQKVTGSNWLGDEAINFYMNLLKQREECYPGCYLKCHFFNTFFYNMLSTRGYDYSRVRRWTLKFDIFALDKVIIPVHMGAHWCLSIINFKCKRVEYYDSMGGRNIECLQKLERYINDEYQNKKKCGPYDMTGWTRYTPAYSVPQQANGYDCGMFMCKFADCSARGEEFDFSQRDMRYFRKRMLLEIITKEATM